MSRLALVIGVTALACLVGFARGHTGEVVSTQPTASEVERAIATDPAYLSRKDAEGLTVLHHAAHRGDLATAQRILELGGDPNVRGARGFTPLHSTMAGAAWDAMLRSMAPPEERDWPPEKFVEKERRTRGQRDPQHGPMQFSDVAQLLLSKGATAQSATDDGFTALHAAAETMNPELVSMLIAAKADANAVYRPRHEPPSTPLVYAAQFGDIEVVRVLLDAGADPAKVPPESRGYLANMAMRSIHVFRLLLDRGMILPPNALKMAARRGRVEVIDEILRRQKSADLDAALYAAADTKPEEEGIPDEDRAVRIVQTLLDAGASPSAPGNTGEALVAAVARGRTGVAKLLKERGAKVDWLRLTDRQHRPAFLAYAAALENRLDRLREFDALGMPLEAMGAALLGRADRLRELIATRQANVVGEAGSTPLFFAAKHGHIDCVRVLLDAKTDPNARIPSWDTPNVGPRPLQGAAEAGHLDVVRLLLDRGADPALLEIDEDDWKEIRPEIRKLLDRK